MRGVLAAAVVLTSGAFGLDVLRASPAASHGSICVASDEKMEGLLTYLRQLVSEPEAQVHRDTLHLASVPPMMLEIMMTDSLCERAGYLINRDRELPDSTSHAVRMIRVGPHFWVEDNYYVGDWLQALIVDSTVSTVLSHPIR